MYYRNRSTNHPPTLSRGRNCYGYSESPVRLGSPKTWHKLATCDVSQQTYEEHPGWSQFASNTHVPQSHWICSRHLPFLLPILRQKEVGLFTIHRCYWWCSGLWALGSSSVFAPHDSNHSSVPNIKHMTDFGSIGQTVNLPVLGVRSVNQIETFSTERDYRNTQCLNLSSVWFYRTRTSVARVS